MPTVSEVLTNFNSGNYHGRLHALTPEDTPFATLLGGFAPGGGQVAFARTFEWQTYDLRAASPTAQVADNADAPAAENRRRDNVFNVLQTHTETVGVGFERMAQHQQFNVPGSSPSLDAQNIGQGMNPVTRELPWQITQMWKQVKRDIEASLISGTFNLPTSNAGNARTRGIVEAIESNVVDHSATATAEPLNFLQVEEAMQLAYDNGGLQEGETRVLMVPSAHKRQLSWDYHQRGLASRSRNVFGVNVQVIETSFGICNVVLNRHVPVGTALVLSFEQMQPWHRLVPPHDDVPGGVSFSYTKARDGNRTEQVLYTSIGLEYGNEAAHAKIVNLSSEAPTDD